jgi:uncharacterized phage protein (TIGR01671 family)
MAKEKGDEGIVKEIKFRGKRLDNSAWVYGLPSYGEREPKITEIQTIPRSKEGVFVDVIPETVGQFTGLHDKNGKEIYEGDILRWKCSKSGSNKIKDYIVTIEWGLHGYQILILDDGRWHTNKSYWNDTDREVIGNTYENPDLLPCST